MAAPHSRVMSLAQARRGTPKCRHSLGVLQELRLSSSAWIDAYVRSPSWVTQQGHTAQAAVWGLGSGSERMGRAPPRQGRGWILKARGKGSFSVTLSLFFPQRAWMLLSSKLRDVSPLRRGPNQKGCLGCHLPLWPALCMHLSTHRGLAHTLWMNQSWVGSTRAYPWMLWTWIWMDHGPVLREDGVMLLVTMEEGRTLEALVWVPRPSCTPTLPLLGLRKLIQWFSFLFPFSK